MHIQRILIQRWRHFDNVELVLPEWAPMICIVGSNGTGKSQILELVAACCQKIGLMPGLESPRGDPFNEDASFEINFLVKHGVIPDLDNAATFPPEFHQEHAHWDRTLLVRKRANHAGEISAGGVSDRFASKFASFVVGTIERSKSIHYLSIDADRAYPRMNVAGHELGEAMDRDWNTANKQSSFRLTSGLYGEWFKFLVGRENQENNKYVQSIRRARDAGKPEPVFVDQFKAYKDAVRKVLPHLLFLGVDPQTRDVKFDSTGVQLAFDRLSGGEREIAFLVGQIERFGLKKGLLLVDEPELHLNYDLLRAWIGFLKDSVELGQIWLATHSLEVVEVTGQEATIMLQRDENSRKIIAATPLSQQPVVATLSRAIGSPAFSILSLAFVFVEGEEEIGERERFRLLCDIPSHVRFLEGGSCKEVLRRMDDLRLLASASKQSIRIGGIVDKDWRTKPERDELGTTGVFVLGVHEVENFFLDPATLRAVVAINGGNPDMVEPLVLNAADRRAGTWIFDAARTDRKFKDFPEPSKDVKELVHQLQWADFDDMEPCCEKIAVLHGELEANQIKLFKQHLVARAKMYAGKRRIEEIWKECEGKQVFRSIVKELGFSDEGAAERAITAAWGRSADLIPRELHELREYIHGI